ncbi:MAG: penicillin-binding protein 2 [Pseudazoarcus pumilus]|nr:penicillin-binding protein 2 [Pseudazoarcus pumilus]
MNKRRTARPHNPLLESSLQTWRARLVLVLLLTGSLVLVARAAWLQGFNHETLQAKGEQRFARVVPIPASRGRITDRHGDILAVSTPVRAIWAAPREAQFEPAEARKLAALLGMDVEALNRLLSSTRDRIYLHRQVAPDVARRIAELRLPGIGQDQAYKRFYPGGEVWAHVLGFTNIDDRGQEGMELAFDSRLRGEPGARRVIRDRRGEIIEEVGSIRAPRDGEDVALSIDKQIQFIAHTALRQAMTEHQAAAGAVVVLDVRSGELLALVNAPTFNPNNRSTLSGAQLRNRAITDLYEPGSTMKPFIGALAMEMRRVTPDTLIDTEGGRMTIGRATISDVRNHGKLTVSQVIEKSSNIGTARIALQMDPQDMWNMFSSLGLGVPLELGFPGAAGGLLRPASSWRPIEQATMSYGHGLSTTLMHMARAYLVFARDGDLLPLSLLRTETPPEGRRVFSVATARAMREVLEKAAGPQGTAPRARVTGYRVAGKTGTAHKVEAGRYTDKYVSSFVGFAPASDPRIVVAVMIDEPAAGQHFGGAVAAPVFSRVTEASLRALGVAPDAPLVPLHLAETEQTPRGKM